MARITFFSGEKPHKCKFCGLGFFEMSARSRHAKLCEDNPDYQRELERVQSGLLEVNPEESDGNLVQEQQGETLYVRVCVQYKGPVLEIKSVIRTRPCLLCKALTDLFRNIP